MLDQAEFEKLEEVYLKLKSCLWFLTKGELESLKRSIDIELKERE